jgi:hypothetical protein
MHVVMMSSGAGSWAAAKRVVAEHGAADTVLLFADTKGFNPSEHAGEDEDNYRFLRQAAANVGAPLVWLVEGRDIWQVFDDEHMIGNDRLALCSMRLKQEPARGWVEAHCDPAVTTVYLGLDWTEPHRTAANTAGWAPWPVEYPMMGEPLMERSQILDWLRSEGIRPPRLYDAGYDHANCGGFCVRMGHKQARKLLLNNPARYAYHEDRERAFRAKFQRDASVLTDRRGLAPGEKRRPLTLQAFRERLGIDPYDYDHDDYGSCACFPFDVRTAPNEGVA